jgi:hypothetical protein
MQLLQPLARDVGVDLRGRDVGVAEQQLHHAQVGAVVEQVRGEGVAQHVRRDALLRNADLQRVFLDQVPEHLPRHGGAAHGDENRVGHALLQ